MTEPAAPSLSIVIPAYNEEIRLPAALEAITAYLDAHYPDAELIIASDGSTDATETITREFAEQSPRVRLLSLPHRGKGHAVKRGMLEAKGAVRLFMDVDLAVPVETIAAFVEETENAPVVIGSRSMPGSERSGEPLSRRIGGKVISRATRLILGLSLPIRNAGSRRSGTTRRRFSSRDNEWTDSRLTRRSSTWPADGICASSNAPSHGATAK